MIVIKLKSIATNYNYCMNNLKDYFLELKGYYKVRLCNEIGSDIDVYKVNENSYIELKIRNDIFELQSISEILGHDLIFQAEHSSKEYLCFLIYDDYWE
jgi:hypothetical protein